VAVHVPTGVISPPLIITGGEDCDLVVWNLLDGTKSSSLMPGRITSIFVYASPGSAAVKIVAAIDKRSIIIGPHPAGSQQKPAFIGNTPNDINVVAVAHAAGPNSPAWILGGCASGTIQVWDLETRASVLTSFDFHTHAITCIAVHNNILVTGFADGKTVVWRLLAVEARLLGKKITALESYDVGANANHRLSMSQRRVNSVALYIPEDGDDRFTQPLLIISRNKAVEPVAEVWGLHTGQIIRVLKGGHDKCITGVAVIQPRDQSYPIVVTCSQDSTAVLWDLVSGCLLRRLDSVHRGDINAVAVYVPEDDKQPARVVTAGDDGIVLVTVLNKGTYTSRISKRYFRFTKRQSCAWTQATDAGPIKPILLTCHACAPHYWGVVAAPRPHWPCIILPMAARLRSFSSEVPRLRSGA
jgi:WD40 repeat protein